MTKPVLAHRLSELVDRYDALLLDLWGVVHDGESPYPGAVDTLKALKDRGTPVVLLSNAPRQGRIAADSMTAMGITSDLYQGILTSGDVVNRGLRERTDPQFAPLGTSCVFLGPDRDMNLLEGTDVSRVGEPVKGAFVLCTGPVELDETEDDYRPILETCAGLRLPMVCANPDKAVMRGGRRVMCAGALAAVYETLGADVIYRGKPDPHIFHQAVGKLGLGDRARIAMIGDGLHTDVPGALASGLDAIFIAGGLNAERLGIVHGQMPDEAKVLALLDEHNLSPTDILPALVW